MSIRSQRAHPKGFTLIEIMVVVAIIGILASLAYPAYTSHLVKVRRTDAQQKVLSIGQDMERYNTTNVRYVTTVGGSTCGVTTPANTPHYSFNLTCTANTFTITATPLPTSTQSADGTQTLDQSGARGGSANGGSWN